MERRISSCGMDSEDTAYQPGADFVSGNRSPGSTTGTVIINPNSTVCFESLPAGPLSFETAANSIASLHTAPSDDSFVTAKTEHGSDFDVRTLNQQIP